MTEVGQQITCEICYCEYNDTDAIKLDECKHGFCKECFRETFRSMIEEQSKFDDLKCPQHGCSTKPKDDEIERIVSEEVFAKYQKFNQNLKVAQNQDLIFCKTPNCEEVLDFSLAQKSIICQTCNKKIFKNQENSDEAMSVWLDGQSKTKIHNCPNCSAQFEKTGGCPHMTCTICKHNWCWTCGLPRRHWFHTMQIVSDETGILCQFVNGFTYQYYWGKHKFCTLPVRVLLTFILGLVFPFAILLSMILVAPFHVCCLNGQWVYRQCVIRNYNKCVRVAVTMMSTLVIYVVSLAICSALGCIFTALTPLLYLLLILRILFMQTCKKRTVRHDDKKLQENYDKQMELYKKSRQRSLDRWRNQDILAQGRSPRISLRSHDVDMNIQIAVMQDIEMRQREQRLQEEQAAPASPNQEKISSFANVSDLDLELSDQRPRINTSVQQKTLQKLNN